MCPTRERSCSPHRLIQAAHNLLRQVPEHAHINLSAARTHRRERRWIRPTASGQVWSARIAMMATQSLTERCAVETLRTLDGAAMNCHMRTRPQPWHFRRITSRMPKQQRNRLIADVAETDESETHKVVVFLHCRNVESTTGAVNGRTMGLSRLLARLNLGQWGNCCWRFSPFASA